MTPPETRALVADSLALWGVAAPVAIAGEGVAVTAPDGTRLVLHPATAEEEPVRWWLERGGTRRPCTGVLGALRALRNAVGAGEAEALRLRVAVPPE
ncbi:MAG TPA: hypothetical protein VE684_11400 [Crenalkalicoccus sp.]|nr:hypothetical protein [Crenalkalicoccus sp.]